MHCPEFIEGFFLSFELCNYPCTRFLMAGLCEQAKRSILG
jgi:hypothetical protein